MAYVSNDFRNKVVERDYSGFVSGTINTTGAMVIVSSQGPNTPILCQSEKDVLTYFGNPSALYPSVFDAIAFCSENACYIASAYATDALFGGVEVSGSAVTAFSAGKTYSTYTFSANTISHTFFSRSPKTDDLAIVIKNSGSTEVFTASLYLRSTYGNALLKTYNYSLTRAKDAAGKSIFIDDVFLDNPYVLVKVNASRSVASYTLTADTPVNFAGGTRGGTPTTSDITTAWGNFNYANKYPCTILMDPIGANEVTVNNIIKNYNPAAFGIIAIQLGKTATTAVTYRKVSVLDSDNCAFYTNWSLIEDNYNGSTAWISNIGNVGLKYAAMKDVYNALMPAGVDENGHGGQLNYWKVLNVENDYSNTDLQNLNNDQINPIVMDQSYGLMVKGSRTMQVANSDTSFIGTRRLYNYIIDNIDKQVLIPQDFKLNDELHRFLAYSKSVAFIEPILSGGYLREASVVCDESNNTDDVLQVRDFILDIYVKVTPDSEGTTLRLTRIAQTQTLADFVK